MRSVDQLARFRSLYAKLVDGLSEEQLFTVPRGFSNHIAWNVGHAVVTQQLLHYGLAGLPLELPQDLVDRYRKGTTAQTADAASFGVLREHLEVAPRTLAEALAAGRFRSFQTYATSTGVILESIEDALEFDNFHEGLHLGYAMAQRRALG